MPSARDFPQPVRPYFEWLVYWITKADPAARVTSTIRSSAEQTRLYRRFQQGLSKYPAAPPGTSLHEQGRAIDIVARPEVLKWIAPYWESLGPSFKWGGRFHDEIHFEL